MTPLGKLSLRLAFYGAVLVYLAGDMFVFHGPLRRKIDSANPRGPAALDAARKSGVVARVYNHQITRSQLDRAVRERLWRDGKTLESLAPANRLTARYAALDELIDHELLRIKAQFNAPQLQVGDAEIQQRLRRFRERFDSPEAMAGAMKSQGIASEQELGERLAAHLQQEKYVESRIGPLAMVTDEEARKWWEDHRRDLTIQERVEVRHVFIATLEVAPAEAQAKLASALSELTAGTRDFGSLAKEFSEDPASKDQGGTLGWMTRARLPADFAGAVFTLPLHRPTLVQSRLGWHLVEVTGRQAATEPSFEQAKPEILAALATVKRHQASTEFRAALRRMEAKNIDVRRDMMLE